MKKDNKFIIESIKMDLFRVVTAAGDLTKELPIESIRIFLEHADKDFEKAALTDQQKALREYLKVLNSSLEKVSDPTSRLHWAENVLTTRCRL